MAAESLNRPAKLSGTLPFDFSPGWGEYHPPGARPVNAQHSEIMTRQQQDDEYFASTLAEESRLAAKATAQESQATAAAGGIPAGWSYYAPAYTNPGRAERRAGVVPAIVGAVVQRGETRGTAVGFERVVCVGGAIGTPEFYESHDSKTARADIWIEEIRALISGIPDITVRDTGSDSVSEYTVYSGDTAVICHRGFSWPLEGLAKSGATVSGAEFAPGIGRAGIWVRI